MDVSRQGCPWDRLKFLQQDLFLGMNPEQSSRSISIHHSTECYARILKALVTPKGLHENMKPDLESSEGKNPAQP